MFEIFEERESKVRSYCRNFPIEFEMAENAILNTKCGESYIDFFSGAGAMNFGHNNPIIKKAILDYLSENKIIHALDMYTTAKENFLNTFVSEILEPRKLDYKIMCCGPTGTNAVEAALKLSRKNKKRSNIIAFSGAFHGMTLGSLALTSDRHSRGGAGINLSNASWVPYATEFEDCHRSLEYLKWVISDDHSGIDKPAAVIFETVQAEGGINVAPVEWLQGIRKICDDNDILLICDDIQVGVGRTGTFFSWERGGIIPDMVILSKSISGFGLPMSLLLIKPELDIFTPAEHNGTFRGNQLAFVGAEAGIKYYSTNDIEKQVKSKEAVIKDFFDKQISILDNRLKTRGIGMIWGIDCSGISAELSGMVMQECVKEHLIIERAGRQDCVLKLLPPLTIEDENLMKGLCVIKKSLERVLRNNI